MEYSLSIFLVLCSIGTISLPIGAYYLIESLKKKYHKQKDTEPLKITNSLALWDIWEDYEETQGDKLYGFFRYRLFQDYLNPKDWYKEVKYFIQRGIRGYSDRDLWSYDWHLSKVIRDGLRDLAKNTHGHPCNFKTQKSWEKKLNEIANSFNFHINGEDDIIHNKFTELRKDKSLTKEQKEKEYKKVCKKYEKLSEKNREKMKEFVEYFGNFWD